MNLFNIYYIIKPKSLITLSISLNVMINFMKKFLKKREKIGLPLEKLEEWFSRKTESSYENVNNKLDEIKQNILKETSKTRENIQNLENAQLKNDKITTREMQFMEGNRDFYTKRINIFIESIKIPEEDINEFIEQIHEDINNLGKNTLKAYQTLQHFFSHETYAIAQNIKAIDNQFKNLKEILSDRKIKDIKQVKDNIKSLKENIEKEKQLKNEKEQTKNKVNELEKEKKNILSEISNKEQSQEFKEYHRLEVEKYKINEQLTELKDEILHYFSVLEHALKKHMKLHPEDEKFLKDYIEDPIKAIVDDYKLDIKNVLEKLEENIHTKKIELKDKKKEKTLQVINKINKAKLSSFLTEYNNLMVELRNLTERNNNHTVIDEIENIKLKLKDKKQDIEDIKNKVEQLNETLSQIDINLMKKQLKEKINEMLDIDLEID
ncbi:hypothetical protein CEE44_04295 [Candidatus Woesearchaeota archaeon B3_Woes]|nr:MAG: hypothetical protein CEE44_04295 [Candidatus Woesearchaeota archaeon B3_Woes]